MRYQSTPEKEFDGDIIITDPCYIIRNENGITKNDWHYCEYGEYMERLGIKNYLFQTHAKYICHQVNCQARMGSGVAKQVRAKYPEVYNAYVGFCNEERNAFGQTQFVQANDGKVVVNMFAQSNYGYDGKLYTDYTAFQSCLKRIKLTVPAGETIAMPFKIGCGLGGGDWNVILGLIQKELSDKYTVELWRKEV